MHWRYTANQPQIGPVDATVLLPLISLLIWPAKAHWSFDIVLYTSLASIVGLWWVGRRGYTPIATILLMRARLAQWLGRGSRPIGHTYQQQATKRVR